MRRPKEAWRLGCEFRSACTRDHRDTRSSPRIRADDCDHQVEEQMLRTIIVDDERLARKKLRILLSSEPGVEIVAECSDGKQSIAALRANKPDLLLLDIQMPDMDGFEVLRAISASD